MEASALAKGRAVFSLDLHPAYSGNPLEGIQLLLEPKLLRWDNELDGVLLAYRNLQRLPSQAEIRPYFPYIQLEVVADVLVFRPTVGSTLCGRVTEMGGDFVGYTVLGALNGAIGRQSIRPELRYNNQTGSWGCQGRPDGEITVGSDILFSVEGVRVAKDGVTEVRGSLEAPWSGSCKAAAHAWPTAFSNPQLWQHARAMESSLPGSAAATSPEGIQLDGGATPAEGPQEPLPKSELPTEHPRAVADPITLPPPSQPPAAIKVEVLEAGADSGGGAPSRKKKRGSQAPAISEQEAAEVGGGAGATTAEAPAKKKKKRETQEPQPPEAGHDMPAVDRTEALNGEELAVKKKKKRKASLAAEANEGVETASAALSPVAVEVKAEQPEQHTHKKKRRKGEDSHTPAPVSSEPMAGYAPTPAPLPSSQKNKKKKCASIDDPSTVGAATPAADTPLANGAAGDRAPGVLPAAGLKIKKPKKSREVADLPGHTGGSDVIKREGKDVHLPNGVVKGGTLDSAGSKKVKKKKIKQEALDAGGSL